MVSPEHKSSKVLGSSSGRSFKLTARACVQQFGEKSLSKTTRVLATQDPYEENKIARLGIDAARPHRATYRKLTR